MKVTLWIHRPAGDPNAITDEWDVDVYAGESLDAVLMEAIAAYPDEKIFPHSCHRHVDEFSITAIGCESRAVYNMYVEEVDIEKLINENC